MMKYALIAIGLTTAIIGRHCIPALAVGFGLMIAGWGLIEFSDGKQMETDTNKR